MQLRLVGIYISGTEHCINGYYYTCYYYTHHWGDSMYEVVCWWKVAQWLHWYEYNATGRLVIESLLTQNNSIKRFSSVMSQTLLFANLFISELNMSLFILVHSYYRFHFCRRKEPTTQFLVTWNVSSLQTSSDITILYYSYVLYNNVRYII